jgi:hypothetical protein
LGCAAGDDSCGRDDDVESSEAFQGGGDCVGEVGA